MLPKLKHSLPLEESLILDDHLKDEMLRYKNENYRKIKAKYVSKHFETPFGNFPKEFCINKSLEVSPTKKRMISEPSLRISALKLPKIQSKSPICGAFFPRTITISEFRRFYNSFQ